MSDIELVKDELNRIKASLIQLCERVDSMARGTYGKEAEASQFKTEDIPVEKIADLCSPMGHVERVKILKSLMTGGKYFTELMNETGLSHSPLYFHLNVLQKAEYVSQEFARGRYLISPLGKEAMNSIVRLYRISKESE